MVNDNKAKKHDGDIQLARTETSTVLEHAHNTRLKPLWNEAKFIDCDPCYLLHTQGQRGNSHKTSP